MGSQKRAQPSGWEEILKNQPQKQGKSGKMGRKRANWEENGKLARSFPMRKGRAGSGPVSDYHRVTYE